MYELRPPAPALQRFIEHYWFVTHDDAPVDLRVDVFVDARADLVFNFGPPYLRGVLGGGATVEHARSNLDAQRLVPIRITHRGLVRTSGVRFRLGGLGPFTRGALRQWTGATPAPSAVLGRDAVELERAVGATSDIDAQARLFDQFFTPRAELDGAYARFDCALAELVSTGGAATVEHIARAAGVSARHVERQFAHFLGVAPKTVARVLRFQRALRALMRDPNCSLALVAADAGYFDHAHFIKDFKRMSGGVPRGYRGYFPPTGPADFAPNVVVFLQDDPAAREHGAPASRPVGRRQGADDGEALVGQRHQG